MSLGSRVEPCCIPATSDLYAKIPLHWTMEPSYPYAAQLLKSLSALSPPPPPVSYKKKLP